LTKSTCWKETHSKLTFLLKPHAGFDRDSVNS